MDSHGPAPSGAEGNVLSDVLFQSYYRLDPWRFDPPLAPFAPLRFDLNNERFSLYANYVHARESDHEVELQIRTLYSCDDVPAEVAKIFVDGLDIPLDDLGRGGDGISVYPTIYRDFVLRVHQHLDRTATDLFNMIRWRFGIDGGPLSLSSHWAWMRWHSGPPTDQPFNKHGFLNRQVPAGGFALTAPEMSEVSLCQASVEIIEEMTRFGTAQPLYHDIFREAWQNRQDNPRSSLVMGIAAAETGLKTAAVDLHDNSGTEWLFENLPSPPIDRMLRDYIQLLPARRKINDKVRRPPKFALTLIKEGVELRNKLVHGRGKEVNPEKLAEILRAVRDVLYLLDYYRGHDWALERCSSSFRAELSKSTE